MKHLLIKSILRNRVAVCISALLLIVASAGLALGISLYHSALSTAADAGSKFRVVPVVNMTFGRPAPLEYGIEWGLEEFPIRKAYYQQLWQHMQDSPLIAMDDRRAYLGFSEGLRPLRSVAPTSFGTPQFGSGRLTYEEPYWDIVVDVTLISKEMVDSGGNPYDKDLDAESLKFLRMPEGGYYPQYFYAFAINEVLAQNSTMPMLDENLYGYIYYEKYSPMNLTPNTRYLLYGKFSENGDYDNSQGVGGPNGMSYPKALEKEQGTSFYMLSLDQGVVPGSSGGEDRHIALPHHEPLDYESVESFTQSSGLSQADAAHWYAIIQNCKETTEALTFVTSSDLQTISLFNTDTMHVLEGRSITPEDSEAVCVVSSELAQANNICVGDIIPARLHNTKVFGDDYLFWKDGTQTWHVLSPADNSHVFAEVNYEVVGIYKSMGQVDYEFAQYFSPNTVFVSAAATPVSEHDSLAWHIPQVMWGFYLKSPDDVEAFSASIPEELRKSVRFVDQGYEHVKPLLAELKENVFTIFLGTLAAWLVVVGIFVYLHVLRGQQTMGTLRSLGMPVHNVLVIFLLTCLGVWLVCALLGGTLSTLLYDDLHEQVYQNIFQSGVYNQAFSNIGNVADQGVNLWTGEADVSGAGLFARVSVTGNTMLVILLALGAQGLLFAGICAGILIIVCRKKVSSLLKGA